VFYRSPARACIRGLPPGAPQGRVAGMKVATWNVNSIRQRETHVQRWLSACQPDVLFLQEIKCEATTFPTLTYHGLGYTAEVVGQKSYNGVAALSRHPFTVTHTALPGLPEGDAQARYIEIVTQGMTLIGIYAPNGNSRGEEGFAYKLAWLDCLAERARTLLTEETPFLITGDFNICPTDEDFAPGALPVTDALVRPESRQRWRRMVWSGLTDAVRAIHPHGAIYTFWDYQAGAWQRDIGLRIDHALLSPELAERLTAADPDKQERDQPQPSDHVPVVFTFK
jgi:exodeoxyribonuclease III